MPGPGFNFRPGWRGFLHQLSRRLALAAVMSAAVTVLSGASQAPVISVQPASVSTVATGTAAFGVTATGDGPLSYQWNHDGVPVPGATWQYLVLPGVKTTDAGSYAVNVSGASGAVTSAPATLAVSARTSLPIVADSFRADPRLDATTGTSTVQNQVVAILPLADGRVVVALADYQISRIVRLLADGTIDPGFAGVAVGSSTPQLLSQADGHVLVTGASGLGILRLNDDGTVDRSFVSGNPFAPNSASGSIAWALAQPDGKIVVGTVSSYLYRLLRDGAIDGGFRISQAGSGMRPGASSLALADDGKIWRAVPNDGLKRLLPDGSIDASFVSPLPSATSPAFFGSRAYQVFRGADGGLLGNTETWAGEGGTSIGSVGGSFQLSPALKLLGTSFGWIMGAPGPDGSFATYPDDSLSAPGGQGGPSSFSLWSGSGARLAMNWGVGPGGISFVTAIGPDNAIWIGSSFSWYNGVATPRLARLNRVAAETSVAPAILGTWAEVAVATYGSPVILHAAANSPGPVSYEWVLNPSAGWNDYAVVRTLDPSLSFKPAQTGQPNTWLVRARNSAGVSAILPGTLTATPGPLTLIAQSSAVTATAGRDVHLFAFVQDNVSITTVEWRRNGVLLPSGNATPGYFPQSSYGDVAGSVYTIKAASAADAGNYAVTLVTRDGQRLTSAPIALALDGAARITNFSVRARVGPGEHAAILGFTLPVGATRQFVLRGLGPALKNFGIGDALPDPKLEFFAGNRLFASSMSWGPVLSLSNDLFDAVGAFRLATDSADAGLALMPARSADLPGGSYTAALSGGAGDSGAALLELYEADNASERVTNLSARAFVEAGADATAGFAIRGPSSKRLLLRAAGPALKNFGVTQALANLHLTVSDSAGHIVATGDAWQNQANSADLAVAAASVGAFAFSPGSADSALILSLPPGNYTATVTAQTAATGVTLIELYELP